MNVHTNNVIYKVKDMLGINVRGQGGVLRGVLLTWQNDSNVEITTHYTLGSDREMSLQLEHVSDEVIETCPAT